MYAPEKGLDDASELHDSKAEKYLRPCDIVYAKMIFNLERFNVTCNLGFLVSRAGVTKITQEDKENLYYRSNGDDRGKTAIYFRIL